MSPAPTHSLSEREVEIKRSEDEVAVAEDQLTSESARLESAAGAILARLQNARAAVAHLEGQGLREGDFLQVGARVKGGELPRLEVQNARAQALELRMQALEARRRLVEGTRQQMHQFASELSRIASQLTADEAALQRYERLARERAEAVAREQAASAAAAAARSVPPPPPEQALRPQRTTPPPPPRPEGRRGQTRVRMQATVDLQSETNFFNGFSTNISEGGLFVATVQHVPLGTSVDLHFTLPDGRRIDVQGEVRWAREVNDKTPEIFPGLGVQFMNLTPEAADAIKTFVASREPMFFPD